MRTYDHALILDQGDEKQVIILFSMKRVPTITDYDTKSFIDRDKAILYAYTHALQVYGNVKTKVVKA